MSDSPWATPSSDIEAEIWTLSAMMNSGQAIIEAAEIVQGGDFFRPLHQEIFGAMVAMSAAGEPVTPVTLRAWLDQYHDVKYGPTQISDLFHLNVPPQWAAHHARIVWDASVRRRMQQTARRWEQVASDRSMSPQEMITRAQEFLEELARGAISDEGSIGLDDFLGRVNASGQEVIPGIVSRQDRVVVVGLEGSGKTVLAHQVAFCLAAGVHPFSLTGIKPGRVLIVDLENPQYILQQRLKGLREIASQYKGFRAANVRMYARPGGINLLRRDHAFKLADAIRKYKPDLIVGGPVYKMFEETGDKDSSKHAAIARFFDTMRERHEPAVWLETHAPIATDKGNRAMRPLGSGIWTRWPEFGIALARDPKDTNSLFLDRFRGDRDEQRVWPVAIERNRSIGARWPWLARYPNNTFNNVVGD